jgi:hypothetical protein
MSRRKRNCLPSSTTSAFLRRGSLDLDLVVMLAELAIRSRSSIGSSAKSTETVCSSPAKLRYETVRV